MRVWPLAIGLQEQVANHRKRRRSKVWVVSVAMQLLVMNLGKILRDLFGSIFDGLVAIIVCFFDRPNRFNNEQPRNRHHWWFRGVLFFAGTRPHNSDITLDHLETCLALACSSS